MCEEKKITNNPILALQKFEKGYENIVLRLSITSSALQLILCINK